MSKPEITAETELTPKEAGQTLQQLTEGFKQLHRDLQTLREEQGPASPSVIQAERKLESNRELLSLYNELVPLLVGPRDEKKSAQIEALSRKLAATVAKSEEEKARHQEAVRQFEDAAPQIAVMQQQLEVAKRELQAREAALAEATRELAKMERGRSLPPLQGELKVYSLASLPAKSAADAIESLFGVQSIRVAVDDRTNSLIVFGKADSLPAIDALLMRLDQNDKNRGGGQPGEPRSQRSLLLRLFWLADGLPEGEGSDPLEILPASVLRATQKLGLQKPRLVAQTVNSLAVGGADDVDFSTSVPAVLAKQMVGLECAGEIKLLSDNEASLEMRIQVAGPNVNCQVQGSLAIPLEHFMVLGTANSVIADAAMAGAAGAMQFRGGYGGRGRGIEQPGLPEVGGEMPGQPQAEPQFTTSRFAFVVQVIDGESFPPEDR